ncbi:MAG TPA: nitroreductase family deazaflavin-dependent oxidoreductase [Blastocatellia bacterium]|jgi:deazaflavin-dependent oxidoreductase (nitroreductase family)|nr:nitroreductase family deazaflavin-dependent oxidoreductase [Blastocatellia bacterium]
MPHLESLSELQVLYLTTTGRISGLPREIEIWFVERDGRLYILAEHFRKANWVRNVERDARVRIRLGDRRFEATGRVLDPSRDATEWNEAQELARKKYGWGEGLPVEFTPDP